MRYSNFPIELAMLSAVVLLTFSACGQTSGDKAKDGSKKEVALKDASMIYKNINSEICECTTLAMKSGKSSASSDSCYKITLEKYDSSLKQSGVDLATQAGQDMLTHEVILKLYRSCPELAKLMEKETLNQQAGKLVFTGELISQTKLPSGLFEIVMKSGTSAEKRTFYAKNPLNEAQIKKYEPGYELTVEYEIVKNKTTNKDEFYLKPSGGITTIGAVKAVEQ